MVNGLIFLGGVPDISHKNKDARENGVFWGVCVAFWGSDGAPDSPGW